MKNLICLFFLLILILPSAADAQEEEKYVVSGVGETQAWVVQSGFFKTMKASHNRPFTIIACEDWQNTPSSVDSMLWINIQSHGLLTVPESTFQQWQGEDKSRSAAPGTIVKGELARKMVRKPGIVYDLAPYELFRIPDTDLQVGDTLRLIVLEYE